MDVLNDEDMFTSRFRDCLVSVDCGSNGVYQGEVDRLNSQKGELILRKVIRNGVSMGVLKARIEAANIKDIKAYRKASTGTADTGARQAGKPKKKQQLAALASNNKSGRSGEFVGCLISLDCGEDGYYQGKVREVDAARQSITLEAAVRDGFPMKTGKVTLLGNNILDLKIVKMPEEEGEGKVGGGRADNETNTASPSSSSRLATLQQPKVLLRQSGQNADAHSQTKRVKSPIGPKKKAWGQPPAKPKWQPATAKKEELSSRQHATPPRHHTSARRGFQEPTPPRTTRAAVVGDDDDGPTGIPLLDSARRIMKYPSHHRDRDSGPSGVPSLDSANGYTSRHPGGGLLEEPLDHSLIRDDFDFDTNLAEFNQLELSEGEESDDESESET